MTSAAPVLISGMGLMGGSLAGALRRTGRPVYLHHYRPGPAQEAERRGLGRAVERLEDGADAVLAVACVPVSAIPATVRTLARALPGAVLTDVGSTKGGLVRDLADVPAYLGSHPMCGSHSTGLDHADPGLYRDRLVIVTPEARTPPGLIHQVESLWRAVGSRLLRLAPAIHDAVVAEASHLPHVLAVTAAALLSPEAAPACAGGFRDTTRVAASSPDLWVDILAANQEALRPGLARARALLAELEAALAGGDHTAIRAWLQRGQDGRTLYERAVLAAG